MSGPAPSKIELRDVKVYLHLKDPATNSRILHLDIESDELTEIIRDGEATYCAGKPGGVFIGLKREMLARAESLARKKLDSSRH